MARKKFIRSGYWRFSKLGLRRKKKQIYRKPKGQGNKVRLNEAGRITRVKIGFGRNRKLRGIIRNKNMRPVRVRNIDDLRKIQKNEIGIVAKMGGRKKMQIAEYAREHKIILQNFNPKKFIAKAEAIQKNKENYKAEREKKYEEKEKKVKEKELEEKKIDEKKDETNKDAKEKHEHTQGHGVHADHTKHEKGASQAHGEM
ncbi:MAG: eL32 family ribosomal protein [Nanoarchaeota archaeon]